MLIIERQRESFAALEAAYEMALMSAEHQTLSAEAELMLESQQIEFYVPLA